MSNHLKQETSPYLLQHADNPVDWYPWCEAAFQKAKAEDKPVFLSIGYSTCHWCHVMARESFEDPAIAALLNAHFVPVKVDREERPDIDSIYMQVCQAYTGAGGWPTSIFMTADQKPFFAGTYFPKRTRGGMLGFYELLTVIRDSWTGDRDALEQQADQIVAHLQQRGKDGEAADEGLLGSAAAVYQKLFDAQNGGFGRAPKFPAPHNLLFLLTYARRQNDPVCLEMAEKTLEQMYRGGLFDHIGYGFCRYSTDDRFLVPHFEKMLYDNAWLILAYCKAYTTTKRDRYLSIAEQTAQYVLREMTAPDGGFYSAQDADSGGEEGAYYLFAPEELTSLLGKETGSDFNRHYGIFPGGNLKGKSIPNLLHGSPLKGPFDVLLPKIRAYRSQRYALHLDDKILTAWNGWMIAALCGLYRASGAERYRTAALRADQWLSAHLWDGNTLFVSFRDGKRGVSGFLDDYAGYLFAQLALHRATWDLVYLERAKTLCDEVLARFADEADGGFYFYEAKGEPLILRPKETYDGATPSGNALMAWNLVRLAQLTGESKYEQAAARQLDFLAAGAKHAPTGHAMFLLALLEYHHPPKKVTIVLGTQDGAEAWKNKIPADVLVLCLPGPTKAFALQNGRTTFYVCHGNACLPPVNELPPDLAGVQGEMAE